jgi:hypothetical protein
MKILLLGLAFFFVGCVSSVIRLRHEYVPGLYEQIIETPKSKVWNSLLTVLSKSDLSIRLADSSSSLIKSHQTKLLWSYENKKGKLNNSKAWVAVERVIYKNKPLVLTSITGEWNIRMKAINDSQTYIVVNLVNLRYNTPLDTSFQPFLRATPRSTGVFEKMICDQLK